MYSDGLGGDDIGFLKDVFRKNKAIDFMYDLDLMDETSERVQMKNLAIQTCVNMIARTISQSEFRIKENGEFNRDELYYRLNVRPGENTSAAVFWEKIIYKMMWDNEALVVQSDGGDLLVADDFTRNDYGIMGDKFKGVRVKNYTFSRTWDVRDVIYFKYNNDKLTKLLDGVYSDYGELIGRLIDFQKHKNQIRATVDMENVSGKDDKTKEKLQKFIDSMYGAVKKNPFAIVPQQKGFTYEEHTSGGSSGQSVDEINKATDGFMDDVAKAMGIPIGLLHGDLADVESQTRNYMTFCIDPLIKKIEDELNAKLISKKEYLNGKHMDIKRVSYSNMFDVATAVDKLRSAGVMNGNELREQLGMEKVDDPILTTYVITKNYTEDSEGGDTSSGEEKT